MYGRTKSNTLCVGKKLNVATSDVCVLKFCAPAVWTIFLASVLEQCSSCCVDVIIFLGKITALLKNLYLGEDLIGFVEK